MLPFRSVNDGAQILPSPAIRWLLQNTFAIDIGKLFSIKAVVVLCDHEHQSIVTEDWFKALARVTEQAPVSKDPAELLRSGIAVDRARQAL